MAVYTRENEKVVLGMTIMDLWEMWKELHNKTLVDIVTSGGDVLEVNQLFYKILPKYKNYKVYTFGCTQYNHFHKVITVEVQL